MQRTLICSLILLAAASAPAFAAERWINPLFKPLEMERRGFTTPILKLDNGGLITVDGNAVIISRDNGRTWPERRTIYAGPGADKPGAGIPSGSGQFFRTADGVLVLVYRDARVLNWDKDKGEAMEGSRGDVWSIRSLDGGKTWIDRHKIFEGICGHPPINLIQTRNGNLVVPVQYYVNNPGRNVIKTYVSADRGKSWRSGNTIDLGGHGHHDGAFEPTMVELRDGRVWMLIRTNWDHFWEAFSEDSGLTWRTIRPSRIEASTSPGYLVRLASGRLALLFNALYPEGQNTFERRAGQYSNVPASWHREEVSITLSEDDGQTWSRPVIIAREKGTWLSYAYLFEREPGLFWIFTGQGKVQVIGLEKDLVWWKQ
jgi:Neuraminidase (sialidase)